MLRLLHIRADDWLLPLTCVLAILSGPLDADDSHPEHLLSYFDRVALLRHNALLEHLCSFLLRDLRLPGSDRRLQPRGVR